MTTFLFIINLLSLFGLAFFIGKDKKYKNFIIASILTFLIVIESFAYLYKRTPVNDDFLFFICNINIFNLLLEVKALMIYFGIYFTIIVLFALYFMLKKFQIKKYKKISLSILLCILFIPYYGFFSKILHIFLIDYAKNYLLYYNKSYQEIYNIAKNTDYIDIDNLKILNSNEKHKNLVLIYLESYDKSYLTNEKIKPYTKYIQDLLKEGEFYNNVEQLDGAMGTTAAIFSSQCGSEYLAYFIFSNPYSKINKNQRLVCLPDILNKAGYNQIFIGGADKKLFNKGNFLLSHNYDVVEDKDSLISQYPNTKNYLNEWGVADKEIFEIAEDKFIKLSNENKPFNMTILTTATHNIEGVYDSRCKNSTDNTLLNAVECTNDLLKDFINFLKNQPNYKDTLIVIMPDHIQYETNVLDDIITSSEKQPYLILLNSNNPNTIVDKNINHADYAEIILKNLNIKSNATFLNKQENIITKNFIHKIHNIK